MYSLKVFSENIFLFLILPDWAWPLRKHWRDVKLANDELHVGLKQFIQNSRT